MYGQGINITSLGLLLVGEVTEMIIMKIIAICIIIYELCLNFIIVPIVKKWQKTKTDEQLFIEHPYFLSGVALGYIAEVIAATICILGWLFVK